MFEIQFGKSRAMQECKDADTPLHIIQNIAVFYAIFIFSSTKFGFLVYKGFAPLINTLLSAIGISDEFIIVSVISYLPFLALIIIPILYCIFIEKRSLSSMGFYGNTLKSIISGIVIGFILITTAVIIQVLLGIVTIQWSGTLPITTGMILLIAIIIQSSGEEILCRGYFMNSIAGRYSWLTAAIINSVIFSALHLNNEGITSLALINITIAGLFFSVITIRFNLWVACIVHTMWNFSQGYIFGINISGMETTSSIFSITQSDASTWLTGGEFGIEGSMITTIIYIIGIALVLFFPKLSKNN